MRRAWRFVSRATDLSEVKVMRLSKTIVNGVPYVVTDQPTDDIQREAIPLYGYSEPAEYVIGYGYRADDANKRRVAIVWWIDHRDATRLADAVIDWGEASYVRG